MNIILFIAALFLISYCIYDYNRSGTTYTRIRGNNNKCISGSKNCSIIVNGEPVSSEEGNLIRLGSDMIIEIVGYEAKVIVEGNLYGDIHIDAGNIECKDCKNINITSGNVSASNVNGDISIVAGNLTIKNNK